MGMRRYRRRRRQLPVSESFWLWLIKALAMPALLATPARAPGRGPLPASRLDKTACEKLAPFGLKTDEAERLRVSGGRNLPDALRRRLGDGASAPDGVVYPRSESEVQALLGLCAGLDIAVGVALGGADLGRGTHKVVVALDLSGMSRSLAQDPLSGRMEVEAGISGAELERLLTAQGLTLDQTFGGQSFETDLGSWIAGSDPLPAPVASIRLATPQGVLHLDNGLRHVVPRGHLGVITAASLRVRPLPEDEEYHAYMFRDFAAGLTVLHQAARAGMTLGPVLLSDEGATAFERAMERRPWNPGQRLFDAWLALQEFDNSAARLVVGFSGSNKDRRRIRRNFEALAKKLRAMRLGRMPMPAACPADALLDQGVGVDRLQFSATWAELPLRYARLRASLKQAMRAHPAVIGAHGQVLAHVSDLNADGALFTITWLFARKLEEEIIQASVIRQAALAAAGLKVAQGLEQQMRLALKHTVDPRDILSPGA